MVLVRIPSALLMNHSASAATDPGSWERDEERWEGEEETCRRLKYLEYERFMYVQHVCYLLICRSAA